MKHVTKWITKPWAWTVILPVVWWGEPEGKRPVRRPRHRWEATVKRNLKERGWQGMDWIHLVHYRDK